MKRVFKLFLVLFVFTLGSNVAFAQDEEVTDEELMRYAVTMDSVEKMKQNIIDMMTAAVEGNENITGARFNELSSIIEDSVKLVAANATEDEINFIVLVKEKKDSMTADINTTFKSLAIDYIGDGGRVYKRVKSAIAKDPEVKARYEVIYNEVSKKTEEDTAKVDDMD